MVSAVQTEMASPASTTLPAQAQAIQLDQATQFAAMREMFATGTQLASASTDGELRIWDVVTGKLDTAIVADRSLGISWHPMEPTIAVASCKGLVDIFDAHTLRRTRHLRGHTNEAHFVAFDPEGKVLVSAALDGTLRTWRTDTWEPVAVNTISPETPISFSGAAAQASSGRIAWLDPTQGTVSVAQLEPNVLLRRATTVRTVHYTSGRVVLVGASSTGKTCLAHALLDQPFQPQESTHGINVWQRDKETVKRTDGSRINRETLLWDLAGQPEYQLVHQLFLEDTAVGVVVFDPTDPENPFHAVKHWERALKRVAGPFCRKWLVAGRVDRGDPTVTPAEIMVFCREYGFEHFIPTSAAADIGIRDLKKRIADLMPWDIPRPARGRVFRPTKTDSPQGGKELIRSSWSRLTRTASVFKTGFSSS